MSKAEPFFGESSQPLRGSGEFSAADRSGSLIDFALSVEQYVISTAKQAIDTPEERAAIEKAIMDEFDQWVAPRLRPIVAAIFRRNLLQVIDDALVSLAK